jgi:hypothetical protein
MKYLIKVTTANAHVFLSAICNNPQIAKQHAQVFEEESPPDPTRKYTLYYVNPINVGPIEL